MRRLLAGILCVCLLLFSWPGPAQTRGKPVLRALLVACDVFLSQPDTSPSSTNNVIALRRALLQDQRGYQSIHVSINQLIDSQGLAQLADQAFSGATGQDISLFYLSTHGIQREGSGDFIALTSDGLEEASFSGEDLYEALQGIPGTKVVILDACYSGAAINKGLNSPLPSSLFSGPDFKVLTSSGALEPSFLWTDGAGTVQGGSFFAQALVDGISAQGEHAADSNRDGGITLSELHSHLLAHYGASMPQVYPQQDEFVVLSYRKNQPADRQRLVSGLQFETQMITDPEDAFYFSYTLHRTARLAYQLVYEQQGNWLFEQPQSIPEEGEDGSGILQPGRKAAALQIAQSQQGLSGYLLMLLVSVVEDRARPQSCVLLSVQSGQPQPKLAVEASPVFWPQLGEEAAFILRHSGGVQYSASVLDAQGRRVVTLAHEEISRPIHLQEEGSCLWWNGRNGAGELLAAGTYSLAVEVWSGSQRYQVLSPPFQLMDGPLPEEVLPLDALPGGLTLIKGVFDRLHAGDIIGFFNQRF